MIFKGQVPWNSLRRITRDDDLSGWSCGCEEVDDWVQNKASAAQRMERVAVWACTDTSGESENILAIFALKTIPVAADTLGEKSRKRIGNGMGTAILLAQMGLHVTVERNQNHGRRLFLQALVTAYDACRMSPVDLLIIDAATDELVDFYQHCMNGTLIACPDNPRRLTIPMPVVGKMLSKLDIR